MLVQLCFPHLAPEIRKVCYFMHVSMFWSVDYLSRSQNARSKMIQSKTAPAKRENPKNRVTQKWNRLPLAVTSALSTYSKLERLLPNLSHNPSPLIPFPDRQIQKYFVLLLGKYVKWAQCSCVYFYLC